jgi:predicted component of type VI protein secretion system
MSVRSWEKAADFHRSRGRALHKIREAKLANEQNIKKFICLQALMKKYATFKCNYAAQQNHPRQLFI